MWTKENRGKYNRDDLRYPSDLTDEEWALVEPLVPPAKRGGRRREFNVREVLNGLLYVLIPTAINIDLREPISACRLNV